MQTIEGKFMRRSHTARLLVTVLLTMVFLFGTVTAFAEGAESSPDREAKLESFKTVGNYVTFGRYEQDNNKSNGPEDIEWIVLDVDGNKVFLLSRYGLDVKQYNTQYVKVTWETSTLRRWLNDQFLNTAFTKEEQAAILTTEVNNSADQGYYGLDGGNNTLDKVYLLSYVEANRYLDVTYSNENNVKARVTPTAYALAHRAWTKKGCKTPEGADSGRWWLRSPGRHPNRASHIYGTGAARDNQATASSPLFGYDLVRPVLWLDLDSDIF